MKIDRLIGILSILLQQDCVTAPFLAEKFEVSRRTINRDIEALGKAGIPIVTTQGRGGGISIMAGYRVDRTLLTSADMQSILAGLKSLDSVSGSSRYQQLMDKLAVGHASAVMPGQHILIDLSTWHKHAVTEKIGIIQAAIEQRNILAFTYYSPAGECWREIEPYLLVFQWSSWYVWGYCLMRRDYRLFKLHRMAGLGKTDREYQPREVPEFSGCAEPESWTPIRVTARFAPEMKWRLIDEHGLESFTQQQDQSLLFCREMTDKNSILGWILSFGDRVELLKPEGLRRELEGLIEKMGKQYQG